MTSAAEIIFCESFAGVLSFPEGEFLGTMDHSLLLAVFAGRRTEAEIGDWLYG